MSPNNEDAAVEGESFPNRSRGKLKIFLGYGHGVGKTYCMLNESQRRKKRGADVVIGLVDPHGRDAVVEVKQGIESIESKAIDVQGTTLYELDVDAIIKRDPELVLIDDLAHTNAPGSKNDKRWQDVEEILDAGISVLSTLNVQNLESLNDQVTEITGVRVQETVPDHVLHEAEEIEFIDLTPKALIHRLERGDVYPGENQVDPARAALFDEGTLSALRELALREAAGRVDEDVELHTKANKERPWSARDRVMICLTPTRPCMRLIRRGWRMGQRMRADVMVVHVESGALNEREKKNIADDFALSARLNLPVITLRGPVGPELVRYCRENRVTHIVLGHSERSRLQEIMQGSIISSLARELRGVDILIVAGEPEKKAEAASH